MADKFTLDGSRRLNLFSKVCCMCRHFEANSISKPAMCCKAFPDGIPSEIWDGRNPHTAPYLGDRGIQFESVKP
jgi:hypothetical protein